MSSTERVIAFHLARLQDKDSQVRLRSIQELVLLEATGALDTLEQIYRTDPDPEVRTAAKRAGRMLFGMRRQRPPG